MHKITFTNLTDTGKGQGEMGLINISLFNCNFNIKSARTWYEWSKRAIHDQQWCVGDVFASWGTMNITFNISSQHYNLVLTCSGVVADTTGVATAGDGWKINKHST